MVARKRIALKISLPCFVRVSGAAEVKDPLCQHLFFQAGEILGTHVRAVIQHMDKVRSLAAKLLPSQNISAKLKEVTLFPLYRNAKKRC